MLSISKFTKIFTIVLIVASSNRFAGASMLNAESSTSDQPGFCYLFADDAGPRVLPNFKTDLVVKLPLKIDLMSNNNEKFSKLENIKVGIKAIKSDCYYEGEFTYGLFDNIWRNGSIKFMKSTLLRPHSLINFLNIIIFDSVNIDALLESGSVATVKKFKEVNCQDAFRDFQHSLEQNKITNVCK